RTYTLTILFEWKVERKQHTSYTHPAILGRLLMLKLSVTSAPTADMATLTVVQPLTLDRAPRRIASGPPALLERRRGDRSAPAWGSGLPCDTAVPGLRKALGRSAGWVEIQLLTSDPALPKPMDGNLRCDLGLSDVARAIELLEKLQESGEVPVHKLQSLKKVLQSNATISGKNVSRHIDFTSNIVKRALGKLAVLGRGDVAVAVSDPVARLCGTRNLKIARMAENVDNEKMAALEAKICHQIEHYFGDFNLPRDKFLKEQIKLGEGWVPLEIMIKFNRLNRLTTDFNVIVEALSKSKAELMQISEAELMEIMTDEYKTDVKYRSVYIKGFPIDATLDDIKEWLEDKGQVLNIKMRRTLHKVFKGSIFAVFDTIESAKKFVETPGQKYKDTDLLILFKDDYFTEKNEERKQNKIEAKLRAKHEQEEKQKLAENAEMKSLEEKIGCLLKFSGDLDDQMCREDLHVLFSNHGEIKWIDFKKLWKAKDANNGNLQLRNKEVTWEVLERDVEKEALKKKSKGRRFKGKGKGNKAAQIGSAKGKVQFQGKKTKFDSDDEHDENGASRPATVAAFAASEGHSHPRVVELPKTDEGLGFNVMGGKEQNSPIYISRIIPGGVAERHGGLKRGDQLLSVNGVSVEGEHHEKAVELLKAAKDSVKLVVRYTPKVLEEMEARFEKLRTARRRQQQQLLIQQQQQQRQQQTQQNHMS
ncbi:hypothetical protein EI555_011016, partial [Monodon monoceros]